MIFKIDGEADRALIESAMQKMGAHFDGAQFNSAFSFAVSYLASLIVVYEKYGNGDVGGFDFEHLSGVLRDAVKTGHETPERRPS